LPRLGMERSGLQGGDRQGCRQAVAQSAHG
jgi:hypothetical protein